MRHAFAKLLVLSLALALGQGAFAQSPQAIDRVEEDWELVVGMPDLVSAGPQLTTTMSPEGDNSKSFVAFNLNYRDLPFRQGGLQLTAWSGQTNLGISDGNRTLPLAIPYERITWTQRLSVSAGQATLEIKNGHSWTWGNFGQGESFSLSFSTNVTDLSSYDPDKSAQYSGAGWQSNRVKKMTLVQVRYYSADTLVKTDTDPRVVESSGGSGDNP